MANETIKNNGRRKSKLLAVILMCMCFFLTACTDKQIEDSVDIVLDILLEITDTSEPNATQETLESQSPVNVEGEMTVHFIDVGQADATLFVQDEHTMLFDAATKNRGDELVEYIKNLEIDYIDVLVLSHPHDDHMGGSAEILNNFDVGVIYGPDIFDINSLDDIGWYNDMINAVDKIDIEKNKGIDENQQTSVWHFPRNDKGDFAKFNIGKAIVEFYAPLEDEYSDLNDYSICAKVTFGTVDIFLTGDATDNVEEALISEGYDLDVEIFQAAHHGSDTGNSREFLEAMSPECIVISCGILNRYNHPVKSVVDLYKEMKIPLYRTDESGDIVMTTNGIDYSFNRKIGTYTSGAEYKEKGN